MTILYIFPHPDDESFGPAPAMHAQLQQGHKVYLYTLTRGGASRQRLKYNLTVDEMGEVRYKEMLNMAQTLGLTGMRVDDLPDSGLQHMDPRVLERILAEHIENIRPDVIVSYPVHGISGFHDHLVMHSIIKRVFLEMKDNGASYLRRLAFYTLPDSGRPVFTNNEDIWRLKQSAPEDIDCIMELNDDNIAAMKAALACYVTYQETIALADVPGKIGNKAYFEFFGEAFNPPLNDITAQLPE